MGTQIDLLIPFPGGPSLHQYSILCFVSWIISMETAELVQRNQFTPDLKSYTWNPIYGPHNKLLLPSCKSGTVDWKMVVHGWIAWKFDTCLFIFNFCQNANAQIAKRIIVEKFVGFISFYSNPICCNPFYSNLVSKMEEEM